MILFNYRVNSAITKSESENKDFTDPLSMDYGSSEDPFTKGDLYVNTTDNFNWN